MTVRETLSILKIKNEEADFYSLKFNNNNFFTTPRYLSEFNLNIKWWLVLKGNEPLCIWPVYINDEGRNDLPLFSYYFGPVWSKYFLSLNNHSSLSKKNEVFEIFLSKFKDLYPNLIFQFDYNNLDVRYFIWKNKDSNNKKKFKIFPKYTSIIKNLDKKNENEIFNNFRTLRKRMIRKFKTNSNFIKEETFSNEEIIELYGDTLLKKNQTIDSAAEKYINIFHKLSKEGSCKIIGYKERKSNKLAALTMITFEKNIANLILNLSSNDHKPSGISASNMLDAIYYAKKKGCKIFDFNGANSEVGAHDKDSYGGIPRLYFQIELN